MNDLQLPVNIFLKKMRKVIEVLLRGRKKRTKHRKWREKKKGDKEIFNKERDKKDAIN